MCFLSSSVPSAASAVTGRYARVRCDTGSQGAARQHSTVAASAWENVIDARARTAAHAVVKSLLRTAARAVVKAAWQSSLFAALLCGTAAALGVVSGLSPVAALRVDVSVSAGARNARLLNSAKLAFLTLGARGTLRRNMPRPQPQKRETPFTHPVPPAPAAAPPRPRPRRVLKLTTLQIFAARGHQNPSSGRGAPRPRHLKPPRSAPRPRTSPPPPRPRL